MPISTELVAWVGAVTGMLALAWDVIKWRTAGPKLDVIVVTNPQNVRGPIVGRIGIRVANIGTAPTTIRTLIICTFGSWWGRFLNNSLVSRLYDSPGLALPYLLQPGEEQTLWIPKTAVADLQAPGISIYVVVNHSWKSQRIHAKVPLFVEQ